jgi:hypothetical protein
MEELGTAQARPDSLGNKYTYDQLNSKASFRLLHLHPGAYEDERIKCTLHPTNFGEPGEYEALSYTWGDPTDVRVIHCSSGSASESASPAFNGDREGQMHITTSLYTALRRFRDPETTRVLWADAICINQQDVEERNDQVARMRDMYKAAQRVLVWLGDDMDGLEDFIPSIETTLGLFASLDRLEFGSMSEMQQWLAQKCQELRDNGEPNLFDTDWTFLAQLLRRPFFMRKWVLQEVTLAREAILFAGDGSHPMSDVMNLVSLIQSWHLHGTVERHWKNQCGPDIFLAHQNCMTMQLCRARLLEREGEGEGYKIEPLSMTDLLRWTRFFKCSDERDHVYAVLGLANLFADIDNEQAAHAAAADYRLSATQVFVRLAIAELTQRKSYTILSLSSDQKRDDVHFPSWAPNMSSLKMKNALAHDFGGTFSAGGTGPALASVVDDRFLHCRGYVVDRVASLASNMFDIAPPPDLVSKVLASPGIESELDESEVYSVARSVEWLRQCRSFAASLSSSAFSPGGGCSPTPSEQMSPERWEQFWRTMMCETVSGNSMARTGPEFSSIFQTYIEGTTAMFDDDDDDDDDDDENDNEGPKRSAEWAAEHRRCGFAVESSLRSFSDTMRLCWTADDQRLGHVPRETEVGDVIVILKGAQVPHVLRRAEQEDGRYVLVGECYVHGMMDGEVVEASNLEEITIVIE